MKRILFSIILVCALFACGTNDSNKSDNSKASEPAAADNTPVSLGYQLIKIYPHDSSSFTEGLQYVGGKFLESSGQYGESSLRITDPETGKPVKQVRLPKEYFGEGCTQLNGKIYQMTWMEKTCFVYDAATLKKTGEFNYNFGEGWGMTTDGKSLIISNGGNNLFWYDPVSFREQKRVGVTNQYGPVSNINELEFIKGFVYANIWQSDMVIKIDPGSGRVVAVFDMNDLRAKIGIPAADMAGEDKKPDVMNGIAYDSAGNRVFITGKYWPKLFEVKFDN